MAGVGPRAVGIRISYGDLPLAVRHWVGVRTGPVEVVTSHSGGMSPGAAVTLRCSGGRRVFVKAVGSSLNEQTPALFRAEVAVLQNLPAAAYRPVLIDAYDDGEWVALLLEHIDGRYPDLGDARDAAAVEATVLAQSDELTPSPGGVAPIRLAATVERWQHRWAEVSADPDVYLPAWAASEAATIAARIERVAQHVPPTTLCHFDIRDDNLLIRPDGTAVVLDWGMARLGPQWIDVVLLAVQLPTAASGHALIDRHVGGSEREAATDFLLAFACSQAWNARQPARPSLPTFAAYCADDAGRMLGIVRRLLDVA